MKFELTRTYKGPHDFDMEFDLTIDGRPSGFVGISDNEEWGGQFTELSEQDNILLFDLLVEQYSVEKLDDFMRGG